MSEPEAKRADPAWLGDWYRDRAVVVTGGYGYLGTGICEILRSAGARLRRNTRGRADFADVSEAWVGELTDVEYCQRLVDGADVIFHFAGQTSILESHARPLADLRANVESTLTLLDACKNIGRKPSFIYAGTATEIGLTDEVPIPKNTPDRPITVYDANKLAAELLVDTYRANGWVNGLTLRIANVFGPGVKKSAFDRGVINKLIARAMAGQDLTYYGDGELVRDYVYVDDLLDAFVRAGAAADRATLRNYVIARGVGTSLRQMFEMIADIVAEMGYPRVSVGSAPWPEMQHQVDKRSFVADISTLTAFCGWKPETSLEDGIRRTAEALRASATDV